MNGRKRMPACPGIAVAVSVLVLLLAVTALAGWLPETRLTVAPYDSYLSANNARCLVTDRSGNLHLVWYDSRDGDPEIYYRGFNGAAWGPELALTDNSSSSVDPAAAVDSSGLLHVVWADPQSGNYEIYQRTFDGTTWTPASQATEGSATSRAPSIAADGLGNLHMVWRDCRNGPWELFYAVFDGSAWSEATVVSAPGGYPLQASIACDDSNHVHVVWDDYRDANWDIYYRRLDGATWGPELRLTDDSGISENPTVLPDSYGNVHVFWDDNRSAGFDIYQKIHDGTGWSDAAMVVAGISDAISPSAAAGRDGTMHLVWYDTIANYPEIFYAAFDGAVWSIPERLTDAARASENPMIALNADGLPHVVWHDERDGNFEIYWRVWSTLPKPEITSIEPDQGAEYTPVGITDLAGANFFSKVEVWLQMEGEEDVQATNEVVVSATQVTCDLDLWDVTPGFWDVVVENPDLQRDTLVAGFRVIPLPPLEVTSIEPDNAVAYQGIHITNLAGFGFASNASVWLERVGEEDVVATNVTVESLSKITCDFQLTGAGPGTWDVVVQNFDGHSGAIAGGFTIFQSLWSDDLRLTVDDSESSLSNPNARSLAVDSQGHLHVVWSDRRDGNREVYYKSFNGTTWSADLRLTDAENGSVNPGIAIDGNDDLHVVWDDYRDGDYEIYYKRRTVGVWGTDTRLTTAAGESRHPSIALDSNNEVYVVWQDKRGGNGTQNIYFRMYDGETWLPEENIGSEVPGSGTPAIAVDGDNQAHVVWYQDYGNDEQLYYAKFDGSAWSDPEILADADNVYGPSVTTDDLDRVHVAWHDNRYGNYEIFYRRFNGISWDAEERVTSSARTSANASLAVDDSGYVHLVWADDRDRNDEIYYTRRRADSWTAQTRLTKNDGESILPSVALKDDGSLHMVWRDYRDGNLEIYYKMREAPTLAGTGDAAPRGESLVLLKVAPNPVTASTRIRFNLSAARAPEISIFDVTGRLVRRIKPGPMKPGPHEITWNGNDAAGSRIAPGIYFLEIAAENDRAGAKVIVLR